jgi:hypothetical protein
VGETAIGLDTEFMRERTYRAELCLLQLTTRNGPICIDPLALPDLSPLAAALGAAGPPVVLHAGRQDLEVLAPTLGPMTPLFDTQVAAALCGHPAQVGYAELVRRLLGHELPKGQTRTDWSRRPLSIEQIDAFTPGTLPAGFIARLAADLTARLQQPDLQLSKLPHSGFKDSTEGPSQDTPILLRQDAYKALTEPVVFTNPDGSVVNSVHTARFGEIEQRFYATTPKGRAMYDSCLSVADAAREKDATLPKRDFAAYEALYAQPFASFPKTMPQLLRAGLIFGKYAATAKGLAANPATLPIDRFELIDQGFARVEGLRYEDFLPVSAAGIFASNLSQYGTQSTAAVKPTYTQQQLEAVLGCPIISTNEQYKAIEAASLVEMYGKLGLLERLPAGQRGEWEMAARKVDGGAVGAAMA